MTSAITEVPTLLYYAAREFVQANTEYDRIDELMGPADAVVQNDEADRYYESLAVAEERLATAKAELALSAACADPAAFGVDAPIEVDGRVIVFEDGHPCLLAGQLRVLRLPATRVVCGPNGSISYLRNP